MAKVFFGRMFVAQMIHDVTYITGNEDNLKNVEMSEGDYVFIKYVGKPETYNEKRQRWDGDPSYKDYEGTDYTKYTMSRLWQAKSGVIDVNENGLNKKKIEFSEVLTFDDIELSDFIRLDFFNLNRNLLNRTQKSTGRSFVELSLVDETAFQGFIQMCIEEARDRYSGMFSNYVASADHRRKIVFSDDKTARAIDVKVDRSDYTALQDDAFLADVKKAQNKEEIDAYVASFAERNNNQKGTVKGKFCRFLRGESVIPSLVGLWDFHCGLAGKSNGHKEDSVMEDAADEYADLTEEETADATEEVTPYDYEDPAIAKGGENVVIYGTPGCGKSHYLKKYLEEIKEIDKENIFRVTFHQDYTNTDFVGQILPVVREDDRVTYQFIPGPFTLALERAIACKEEKIVLVIEELNRGNAAGIFGDLFQLLDRRNGISEYELTNIPIVNYLKDPKQHKSEVQYLYNADYIRIPSNLFIYATMNTGDQNVFTLDTAFKRRWKFKKLSNEFDDEQDKEIADRFVPGLDNVTWKTFVRTINSFIIEDGTFDSEDKQIGKYFVTRNMLLQAGDPVKAEKKEDFAFKVLEYLWNDVAKFDREKWFDTNTYKTLDSIVKAWCSGDGAKIFNSKLRFPWEKER